MESYDPSGKRSPRSPHEVARGTVKGKLAEQDVVIELITRGDDPAEAWTENRVDHRAVPMSLALRPQTLLETAVVVVSRAVDVTLDHKTMDRAFVIDGAPADAVRRVLEDGTLRQRLLSLCPVEVEEKGMALQIAKKGWIVDQVEAMLMTVVSLATRMEALAEPSQLPYRNQQLVHVEAELDALALARGRRLTVRKAFVATFVAAFIASVVLLTSRGCHA